MSLDPTREILVIDDDYMQNQIVQLATNLPTRWIPYPDQILRQADKYYALAIIIDHDFQRAKTGLDFIPELRAVFKNVPIIMLSGSLESHLAIRAVDAGADEFLAKPLNPDDLRTRLRVVIHRYKSRLSGQFITFQGLTLNLMERTLHGTEGRQITALTHIHTALIGQLLKNGDEVTLNHTLMLEGWKKFDVSKTALYKQIVEIRKHIMNISDDLNIVNKYSAGYRIEKIQSKLKKTG